MLHPLLLFVSAATAAKTCYLPFYRCFGQLSYDVFTSSATEICHSFGGKFDHIEYKTIWCRDVPSWVPEKSVYTVAGVECSMKTCSIG